MNKLLNRLDYKYGKYGIQNLMLYVVIAMGAAFIVDLMTAQVSLQYYMVFSRDLLLSGEWWRVISWIFIPPDSNLFLIIFSLYFYYLIGNALERQWGSFKFNVYYLVGIIFTLAGGFIMGVTTNMYLNLSLFFAFAVLYPNFQVMLFFIIPIKIKWLALLNAVVFVAGFIMGDWGTRIAIVVSLLNFFLFFFDDFRKMIKNRIYYFKHRKKYKGKWN